jgi:hypothetical protein
MVSNILHGLAFRQSTEIETPMLRQSVLIRTRYVALAYARLSSVLPEDFPPLKFGGAIMYAVMRAYTGPGAKEIFDAIEAN